MVIIQKEKEDYLVLSNGYKMNNIISKRIIRQILKRRPKKVHKKQLGQILVMAGSKNMSGAGLLVVKTALRAGIGLVTAAYPECLASVYRKILLEALHLILPQTKAGSLSVSSYARIIKVINEVDLVASGPGLTRNKQTESLVIKLVKNIDKPLVIDADGLNALADSKKVNSILKKRKGLTILTPHTGEMSRLTGLSAKRIDKSRNLIALKYARWWQSIVVLKGYHTVIASPKGRLVINKTGGPVLATAGTGDVLTGIIATLVAQNLEKPFEAAVVAVYLHGLAGDLAAKKLGERSVIASDLIEYLPRALTLATKQGKLLN